MTLKDVSAVVMTLLVGGACLLAGCGDDEPVGPPTIRLGRDECAECGMSIVEERSAAAARVRTTHGVEELFFDDMGCLLDLERGDPELRVTERWTRDYATRGWARAEDATYVFSEKIHTPMGSWIAAFAQRDAAEAARADAGGDVLTFEQLRDRRRLWMEDRYGKREP